MSSSLQLHISKIFKYIQYHCMVNVKKLEIASNSKNVTVFRHPLLCKIYWHSEVKVIGLHLYQSASYFTRTLTYKRSDVPYSEEHNVWSLGWPALKKHSTESQGGHCSAVLSTFYITGMSALIFYNDSLCKVHLWGILYRGGHFLIIISSPFPGGIRGQNHRPL